jgi:hypothetical protein
MDSAKHLRRLDDHLDDMLVTLHFGRKNGVF